MPWYAYKSGSWNIAVDALNQRDAAQHIKHAAPGATFEGIYQPPTAPKFSNYTAMVTERRDEQIRAAAARFFAGVYSDSTEAGAAELWPLGRKL